MERDLSVTDLENRSPLPTAANDGFSRKTVPGSGAGDRLKRDEWSEGAVSSLLEAYESKWILRNRAKLKGNDWEDVARHVSSRGNSCKSAKTQTQCKNKIESMKKRYRSESAIPDSSSWPLFPRLDILLRGTAGAPVSVPSMRSSISTPLVMLEPSPVEPPAQPAAEAAPSSLPLGMVAQNSCVCIRFNRMAKEDGGVAARVSEPSSEKNMAASDSSTPALYSSKDKIRSKKMKKKPDKTKKTKRPTRRSGQLEIAKSIGWLAETISRSEQSRVETMKKIEKMKVQVEVKRAEMDLKRTEIIANMQLEIAKLFASASRGVDSSLRIGRI